MSPRDAVLQAFHNRYEVTPDYLVRAPGRVNLIGEHTDYNDGFVLPMAIDRAIWIALRPRDDARVLIHSLDFDESIDFDLTTMVRAPSSPAEYVKGIAWALQEANYTLKGWEGVMQGDIPIGAGLSSSAALELATARAFICTNGAVWDAKIMARLAQKAENQWVGVNCGIMDQMISACGEEGHALLIDCRSLATRPAPLPEGATAVVLDTGTRRGLVDSAYNERREQCEAGSRFFGVEALRDVTLAQFNVRSHELDALIAKRSRHVISENERTLFSLEAMRAGDATTFGALMRASHVSLRDDFEVSSEALNLIVDIANAHPTCYGARMTGAGFGGCAVALVDSQNAEDFADSIKVAYEAQTSHKAQIYISRASQGASIVPI